MGVVFAKQYTLKRGFGKFGDRAGEATTKSLKQIHGMGTYQPLDATKLTKKVRMEALSFLLFITEKRDGRIESHKCVTGSKQQQNDGYDKAAGSSPTVSTDGLIVTTAIDAHEGRDVANMDIPIAFLHAKNNGHIIMLLRGKMVKLLVKLQPELYRKYVITGKNGEPMLYVKLLKALYGLLKAVLVFYKKLAGELVDMGFEINPYDPSVANKIVDGTQMTVTWHVNDLKVSDKDPAEVSKFLLSMAKIYGPGITVTRGKVHPYLGMDFDYSTPQPVKVSMIKYAKQIIGDFSEAITSTSSLPVAGHLFDV